MRDSEGRARLSRVGDLPLTNACWRIWVDTGGTFTDGLAVAPDGSFHRTKILSTGTLRGRIVRGLGPQRFEIEQRWNLVDASLKGLDIRPIGRTGVTARVMGYAKNGSILTLDRRFSIDDGETFELSSGEEAPVLAARLLTATPVGEALPPCEMRLATTLATNALLERGGDATALFVTRGFEDLSLIGTQQRPDLFVLDIRKPPVLNAAVVGVDERLAADGAVLRAIDPDSVTAAAQELLARGIRCAAIALMHSYRNPRHEHRLAAHLKQIGFDHIACSADLAPRIKLLPRLETAVVDAYLGPLVRGYLDRVRDAAGDEMRLLVMTSAGGLNEADSYRATDSLLSGPAGGIVGAARSGMLHGRSRLLGFDMGGTSTDVARFDGDYEYVYEHGAGEVSLAAPALGIESVAAGGGSICWLDGERLRVGPRSAGADPGPACYGAGGPLCLTDLNLLLGRIDPDRFGIPLCPDASRQALEALSEDVAARGGERSEPLEVAEGLMAVANETMADAIRRISLRRGYDPSEYTLVSFGGAGGQHAASIARLLGVSEVLVPRDAALLSAIGLGHAVIERFAEEQVLEPLDNVEAQLAERFETLARRAIHDVESAGVDPSEIEVRRRIAHLRWAGQESTLEIDWIDGTALNAGFALRYHDVYGHHPEDREIELESIRVVASSIAARIDCIDETTQREPRPPTAYRSMRLDGADFETPVFERDALCAGAALRGPALVVEPHSTTVVPAGWSLTSTGEGLLLTDEDGSGQPQGETRQPEAVRLELFTQRFSSLVVEMGERLERTSVSTNVKERLDFSCALLDPGGLLVVNAPHIPVHLGALGLCVRRLSETIDWQPGDVVLTNHPAFGGSHLPDITVVTPVFEAVDGGTLLGFVANRAHHAEIGGSRPGSMPPDATTLDEEGVVLLPFRVVRNGKTRWDELRERLGAGRYPSRSIEDNLADLRAAVAANHAGAKGLRALSRTHSSSTLHEYMSKLARLSRGLLQDRLRSIPDGAYTATEKLDDGTPLAVCFEIHDASATIDFSGSGAVHPGNLNATPAIVQSAVIYVLRLLIDRPLPLNEGLLEAVTLHIPSGILDPDFPSDPQMCPAVVGGNVETSQRLVDAMIRALNLAACSQGTMNNLIFGNANYGYYETIGGGAGATKSGPGASGIHTHMTNTRITDPELLEKRYPVRLERFSLRHGSGGSGRHRGGDGLIREITFLEPASLSVLAQHRVEAPFGIEGGAEGATGRQSILRVGGRSEDLAGIDRAELEPGDRLIMETPGGGGWGAR